ncbi:hypothetical protein HDU93_005161 [Gonapodya sp. JEL0774]|nr:hypothetical protein HDU93_005161 [Gonapodya sp. JEL0774]
MTKFFAAAFSQLDLSNHRNSTQDFPDMAMPGPPIAPAAHTAPVPPPQINLNHGWLYNRGPPQQQQAAFVGRNSDRFSIFTPHDPTRDDPLPEVASQVAVADVDQQSLLEYSFESEFDSIPANQQGIVLAPCHLFVQSLPHSDLTRETGPATFACFIQAKSAPPERVTTTRPPCDLVAVLDKSGSMSGSKMDAVRQTLKFMIEEMSPGDRLSLVAFDTQVREVLPLVCVSPQNRDRLEDAIRSLNAGGGTNIALGLRLGIDIMAKRTQRNTVKAIFLMSDGQDTEGQDWTAHVAGAADMNFGFGTGHDSNLLSQISARTSGSFNYAESVDAFRPAMAGALGALSGQCVQDFVTTYNCPGDVTFTNVKSGSQASEDVLSSNRKQVTVKYADMIYGEKKVVVFQSVLPRTQTLGAQPVLEIVEGSFRAIGAAESSPRVVIARLPAPLTVLRTEDSAATPKPLRRRAVVREIIRLRVSDAIKAASQNAEGRNYSTARETLQPVKAELELLIRGVDGTLPDPAMTPNDPATLISDRAYYTAMLSDVNTAMSRVSSYNSYETSGGSHWMREAVSGHRREQLLSNVK